MEPSLPTPGSSLSFWHQTTRSFPYLNANRDTKVPSSAKYLIIGSGISGVLTAWELVNTGVKGEEVLVLEAREAVSGATGRNAGHIRPDAFRGFSAFSSIHGPDQAKKIIESEKVVLEKVKHFIAAHNIDCDFVDSTTMDVCLTREFEDYQAKSFAAFKAAGGDVSHVKYYQGNEAKSKSRNKDALSVYEWPAASNHPAKLTQWILSDFIRKGGQIWTHCPVTKVEKHSQSRQFRWNVHTPRGVVAAHTVIHCTNAYAPALLPHLINFITPLRAQAHAYVATPAISGEKILQTTLSLRYSLHHFFSLIQRPSDGIVIMGGSSVKTAEASEKIAASKETYDDGDYSEQMAENSKKQFNDLYLEPRSTKTRPGEGLPHVWTGILGMTTDSIPLLGPIDGLEGQWICAGFNGHGMARIFLRAPGLVKLISGKSWESTGLPECFRSTRVKMQRMEPSKLKMSRPKVMLLGTLEHAQDAWSSLAPIADSIRPKSTNRADFIKEAKSGAFDGVVALYRDYYSVTVSGRFDAELLDAMPKSFKYICHNGAGYDQIDVAACTERGIQVSHTPGAVNESTADLAIWLAVGALRNLPISVHSCHAGAWRGNPAPALGHDPQGKTMGILGFGGIGRTVAKRAMAFGMTVNFYDPFPVDPKLHGGARSVSLDTLLEESDIISIHIPLTPETHHFISTPQFDKMKDGVVVVNTARGPILDEAALVKALASGKVASAGLDVFEKEPEINPGLLANKKVLLVPHMGTWSVETQTKMEVLAIDNVRSAVTKNKLITQVPEQRSIAKL
ncbi:unnamed protein product [Clonostachys byssicola]|uniref:Uncharacterized protein n=1 Tax=Clonostachys byssicola TaxID=160290 RepID=A0A9N9Y5P3_9HYPO|nr:unnamed protein product [Clonostachys byssicola]